MMPTSGSTATITIQRILVPVLAEQAPAVDDDAGDASPDDPDLGGSEQSGVDLVMREFGAVPIGEIGES